MDPTADLFTDEPVDTVASVPAAMESDPLYADGGRYDEGPMPTGMADEVYSTFGSGSKQAFLTTHPITLNELYRLSTRRK